MKIDHIAVQVEDIYEGCEWYHERFGANVLYFDQTWALLEFDNIKMALVLPNQHENHVAIEVNPKKYPNLNFKQHRDGSNNGNLGKLCGIDQLWTRFRRESLN